jgi:hypothetical protein
MVSTTSLARPSPPGEGETRPAFWRDQVDGFKGTVRAPYFNKGRKFSNAPHPCPLLVLGALIVAEATDEERENIRGTHTRGSRWRSNPGLISVTPFGVLRTGGSKITMDSIVSQENVKLVVTISSPRPSPPRRGRLLGTISGGQRRRHRSSGRFAMICGERFSCSRGSGHRISFSALAVWGNRKRGMAMVRSGNLGNLGGR